MKRYRKKYLNKKRRRKHMITVMAEYFILVIIACVIYLCYTAYESNQNNSLYNDKTIISKKNFPTDSNENAFRDKFVASNERNPEVIGWISVDDTDISYPLLQTTDNNYYLTHNYKKEVSNYGSIYMHKNSVLTNEFANLIIYGHNLNGGSQMFSTLMNYKNKDFYQNHKTIRITTNDREYVYTIFAVMKSKVYDTDEDVFKYYYYTDLSSKDTFTEYVSNCKKYQLYNTNVSAVYGNQLISLVTCEYSQDNGRLIVIGKKVKTSIIKAK
jgi:sortase B